MNRGKMIDDVKFWIGLPASFCLGYVAGLISGVEPLYGGIMLTCLWGSLDRLIVYIDTGSWIGDVKEDEDEDKLQWEGRI